MGIAAKILSSQTLYGRVNSVFVAWHNDHAMPQHLGLIVGQDDLAPDIPEMTIGATRCFECGLHAADLAT